MITAYRNKVFGRFTFHYVSIKSGDTAWANRYKENLHSTMYLLNRNSKVGIKWVYAIYIPLCIY